MKFTEIELNKNLQKALLEINFKETTDIQSSSIPFLLKSDQDLIGLAQTGTGKTGAFGIPIIEKIKLDKNYTQCIILCPTRELCIQIKNDLDLFAKYLDTKINAVYGGTIVNL